MRYTESHKQETRTRVLKVAAAALREKGPDKLAVAEVMADAGLTHGGFYAHFKSKDALLTATLNEIFAQSAAWVREMVAGLPPRHALATYIDFYVSAAHRDNPGSGCPITALSSDLPRQSRKFQNAFDSGVKMLIGTLASWIEATGAEQPEGLAASILSAMVGAVSLARAVTDRQLSDELLAAARSGIKARLGLTDAALAGELRQ